MTAKKESTVCYNDNTFVYEILSCEGYVIMMFYVPKEQGFVNQSSIICNQQWILF